MYVVEHLGDRQAVLVFDETGFLKKGPKSVGVQRQDSGTAGRVENCPIGVFWAYVSPNGRTCIDRELYVPKTWADDPARRREAGMPGEVTFATKPQLAQRMLVRALSAGVRVPWVTGDDVYGSDPALRCWQAEEHQGDVLAVRRNERVWSSTGARLPDVTVAERAATRAPRQWQRLSAGDGATGPRL